MIDENKLIEELEKLKQEVNMPVDIVWNNLLKVCIDTVNEQPKVSEWIPVSKRLPKERDSIFKKVKGTDKWSNAMFESISDDVNVTVEYEDGTRKTITSNTLDGIWKCEKDMGIKRKAIAWMPFPGPYKE